MVFTRVCAFVQVHTCVGMCGGQRKNSDVVTQAPSTLFWDRLSHQFASYWLSKAGGQWALRAACPHLPQHFLCGFWELNLGSYTWEAGTVPTEPSHNPYLPFSMHNTMSGEFPDKLIETATEDCDGQTKLFTAQWSVSFPRLTWEGELDHTENGTEKQPSNFPWMASVNGSE